jgi:uncharacterized RDD family membrane protein YckC
MSSQPPQYPPPGPPQPPQYGQPPPQQYQPPQQQYQQPPPGYGQPQGSLSGPGGTQRAEFVPRAIAYLIDGALIGGLIFAFVIVLGILSAALPEGIRGIMALIGLIAYLAMLVVAVCYQPYFWMKSGQTLGQKLMGIKVVDAETGNLLDMSKAVLRYLILALSGSACALLLLWPLWDPLKEALHDKVAKTVVIKA